MGLVAVPDNAHAVSAPPVSASASAADDGTFRIFGNTSTINIVEVQAALLEQGIMIVPRGSNHPGTYVMRRIPSWLTLNRLVSAVERVRKGR